MVLIFYYHLNAQKKNWFHKIDYSIESQLKSVLVWASRGSLMTTRQFFFQFVSYSKNTKELPSFLVAGRCRKSETGLHAHVWCCFLFSWSLFTDDLPLLTREPGRLCDNHKYGSSPFLFLSSLLLRCYQRLTKSFINGTTHTLVT